MLLVSATVIGGLAVTAPAQASTTTLGVTTGQPGGADAKITNGHPAKNYGTASTLRTNVKASPNTWLTYLRFDVSAVPVDASITSVTLTLGDTSGKGVSAVYPVNDSAWTETGVTWNYYAANRSTWGATALGQVGGANAANVTSTNLGAAALSAAVNGALNLGLAATSRTATFASNNSPLTDYAGEVYPTLTITYSTGSSSPPPTGPSFAQPCGWGTTPPVTYRHVIWIWMENHSEVDNGTPIYGNSAAPYLNQLTNQCATSFDYKDADYGDATSRVLLPSGPNYMLAVWGAVAQPTSTASYGVGCDPTTCPYDSTVPAAVYGTPTVAGDYFNLFEAVRGTTVGGSALTAKSYQESMPSPCYLSNAGRYAVRHNPQAYFTDNTSTTYAGVTDSADCTANNVAIPGLVESSISDSPTGVSAANGGQLYSDLQSDSTLPSFSLITPNIDNDMHGEGITEADNWLQDWMSVILDSPAYTSGDTAIFVVSDENTPNLNIEIAPTITPGTVSGCDIQVSPHTCANAVGAVNPTLYTNSGAFPTGNAAYAGYPGDAQSYDGMGHLSMLKTTEQMLGIDSSRYVHNASNASVVRPTSVGGGYAPGTGLNW